MKRIISTLLTLALFISALPQLTLSAFADEIALPDVIEIALDQMTVDNGDIWYTFDNSVGTTVVQTEVAGPKDSVELSGTFVPNGGAVGGALSFNGTSDYVKVNNDDKPSTGTLHGSYSEYSVSFWFNPQRLDGIQMLYIQGDPANETGVAVRLNGTALEASVSAKAGDPTVMDSVDVSGYLNEWVHVAFTFANGSAKLYVNAELKSEKTVSANTIAAIYSGASIGKALFADGFGATGDCGQYFQGMIDDYRVYKSAIVPRIKIQSYSGVDDIVVSKGTAQEELELPTEVTANLSKTLTVAVSVNSWSSSPEYDPQTEDTYVFTASADVPGDLYAASLPQITVTVGKSDPDVDSAVVSARNALEELTLRDDTSKEDVISAIIQEIANENVSVSEGALEYSASSADAEGYIKGTVQIKKDDVTRSVTVDVVLPRTGDILGTVSLMSAARKNHYIRDNGSGADIYYNVASQDRSFVRKSGLADSNGVSFRLAGTQRYLQASNGKLIIDAAVTDEQKQAATFYASDGEQPVWAEVYDGFFEKYATYADSTQFIKANISDNTLYIGAIDDTDKADRLSASFKKTADNTDVIENLRGAVYYPSYSYNGAQFFKFYDSAIIERDMQYAESLGINAFRIWVSYEYWLEDSEHFKKAYDDFLSLADKYGIKILVSLFEGCSVDNDYNVRDYSASYSVTSPSAAIYDNQSRWNEPKEFIDWFMQYYKDDTRQMAIEVYNEPWGTRENLAAELLKYIVTKQGRVAISLGTAPSGDGLHSIAYSVKEGVDIIQYHANFPANTTDFATNAKTKMSEAANYNLPLYCTEVQWVGGPSNPYDSHYENLAPTCNELSETGKWAPFYWTLMVHPCYLPENRQYKLTNGIFQEDGSVWSVASAAAIAPEADTSGLTENKADPYTQYYYSYTYSDNFIDNHGYKWTLDDTFEVDNEQLSGVGTAIADLTKFENFAATLDITGTSAGLLFRAEDKDNGLYAEITDGTLALCKLVNGVKTLLAQQTVEPQESCTLKVTANGSKITAGVGDASVEISNGDYTGGLIGLRAESEAVFDNLLVSAAEVEEPVPTSPENLTVVRTDNGVKLLWNEVSSADSYIVLRAEDENGEYTQIAQDITEAGYTDESALSDKIYYYCVAAVNQNGTSLVSKVVKCLESPAVGATVKMPEFTSSNGLVWYKFDEAEGSAKASSSVVSSQSAVLSGTFLPASGLNNGAILFDGANDYVQINAANTTTGLLHDGFTKRSFSFYMCPFSLEGKQMLMKIGGDLNGIAVRINDGMLEVAVAHGSSDDASTQYIADNIELGDEYINRWTHVAIVFDTGTVSVYLDGELVSQGKANSTSLAAASRASYLGACGDSVSAFRDTAGTQNFNGLMDDFKVYNDASVPTVAAGTAEAVTATPGSGEVSVGTEITLSTATQGAYIMYSLNSGKTWQKYSSPIKLTSLPATIQAYATADDLISSEITEFTYTAAKTDDVSSNNTGGTTTTTPTVTNGTQVVNGKTVLYVNGKQVIGTKVVTVSGKSYAVVGGYVKTGKKQVVKIKSLYYIVNASGVVQKGTKNKLIKVGTKSYVVNKNGVVQRKASGNKLVKVGTKSYIVNKLGVVQKGSKNKLVKIGKKAYIVNKKGVVQKNKKSIKVGKKTYKTNKKGVATLKK